MMKRYVMAFIIVFLYFSLFPSGLLGQETIRPEEVITGDYPVDSENFLDLTPEQESKLKEFRKMRQEERKEFQRKMREVRKKMAPMMRDPEANEKAIQGLYQEIAKLRSGHLAEVIMQKKEIKKILTPEQLEKLEKAKKRITQRRFQRNRSISRRGSSRRGRFRQMDRMRFPRRRRYFRGRLFLNNWRRWR
jgi:hypothetical protein